MRKYAFLLWAIAIVSAQVSFTGNTETRIGESSNGFYYNKKLINKVTSRKHLPAKRLILRKGF